MGGMMSGSRWILSLTLCASLGALVEPKEPKSWQRIRKRGFFTVSLDPDNLPYSARKGRLRGIEVELVHALAKRLGLTVKIDWIHLRHETSLGKLLDGECDLVMGLPVDPRLGDDERSAAGRILYSRPYYRSGYVLFVRRNGPRINRLKMLKGDATRRVGTQAGTLADFVLKQRGYRRKLYGSQWGVLKALVERRIDYAYLWSNATWLALQSPELGVEIVQPYELEDWRDMAAAVRKGDHEFRTHLNSALGQLVREQFVERLLSRYGMPYYPPAGTRAKEAAPPREQAPAKESQTTPKR